MTPGITYVALSTVKNLVIEPMTQEVTSGQKVN